MPTGAIAQSRQALRVDCRLAVVYETTDVLGPRDLGWLTVVASRSKTEVARPPLRVDLLSVVEEEAEIVSLPNTWMAPSLWQHMWMAPSLGRNRPTVLSPPPMVDVLMD